MVIFCVRGRVELNSDNGKAWPPNTPGAQEAEDDIQQQTPKLENNTRGLRKQMQSSNEAT